MAWVIKFFLLSLIISFNAFGRAELAPFSSDGCSSWPDAGLVTGISWKICCFEHDVSYWMGGTEEDRLRADEGLKACVGKRKNMLAGWVMFSGVRVGGSPGYDTPYRWGYGWNYARPYKKLSPAEIKTAETQLNNSCLVDGEENAVIDSVMKRKKLKISKGRLFQEKFQKSYLR